MSLAFACKNAELGTVLYGHDIGLEKARRHIHGQRQQERIERERKSAVQHGKTTDGFAGDGDIGSL
jgi:hypothetical protein